MSLLHAARRGTLASSVTAPRLSIAAPRLSIAAPRLSIAAPRVAILLFFVAMASVTSKAAEEPPNDAASEPPSSKSGAASVVRSVQDGDWSAPSTWEQGRVPSAGDTVVIREGHRVIYDVDSRDTLRTVQVSGTLDFSREQDTCLTAGLIRIEAGNEVAAAGFECAMPMAKRASDAPRPSLLVGTRAAPIPEQHTAKIRLEHLDGMDETSLPAIVCCGGRMEFHGTPLTRTWVKLKETAHRGESMVLVPIEGVRDWKTGDRLIVTGTTRQFGYKRTRTTSVAERPYTEERVIRGIRIREPFGVAYLFLDQPLEYDHTALGDYRCEVANLSRNVIVESADPDGVRGHTMYHRHSRGSISFAEFRHLGKKNTLGRYAMHFHRVHDTMRGASVVGASIWDSHNRWITVHNTSYLVVRDCVGYKSIGHGFFLEDGSETYNLFDRNLAVQSLRGRKLPDQVLPFDSNLGSGFWWANSLNSFTRNVAVECDQDGFRYHVVTTGGFDPVQPVLTRDGSVERKDIRTLPFLRFEDNEAHCQRFFGLNLGGTSFGGVPPLVGEYRGKLDFEDVQGVGPDIEHPFVIRDFRCWNTLWPFHAGSPSVLVDGMDLYDSDYGIWRTVTDHHEYRRVRMDEIQTASIFYPRAGRPEKALRLKFLSTTDDRPPVTVITHVERSQQGGLVVHGSTADNGQVARVVVCGQEARPVAGHYSTWSATLPKAPKDDEHVTAFAIDAAGNREPVPHQLPLRDDLRAETATKGHGQ
jgi:hypothetical protein